MEESLIEQVESYPIDIPVLPVGEVLEKAIEDYNQHQGGSASVTSDKQFLTRITRNFIRHRWCYEQAASFETGPDDPTMDQAYGIWRKRIAAAIAEAYPTLDEEICTIVDQALQARAGRKIAPKGGGLLEGRGSPEIAAPTQK